MVVEHLWDVMQPYTEYMKKKALGIVEPNIETIQCKNLIKEVYKPGMKILDVGCGAGHYLYVLKKDVHDYLRYTGIDKTKYSIETAKEVFKHEDKDFIRFVNVDIHDIWGLDPIYDIVYCFNFLLHLKDYKKALANMLSLTKKHLFIRSYFYKVTMRDERVPYIGHIDMKYYNTFKIPYVAWNKEEMMDFIKSQGDFEIEEIQDYTDFLVKIKGAVNLWKILKITRN